VKRNTRFGLTAAGWVFIPYLATLGFLNLLATGAFK